jgi:hypothetical protein
LVAAVETGAGLLAAFGFDGAGDAPPQLATAMPTASSTAAADGRKNSLLNFSPSN